MCVCFDSLFAESPKTYTERGKLEEDHGVRKSCHFYKSHLGSCSGETDDSFGFSEGKPCLIVKLNRIVNFRPKVCVPCMELLVQSFFPLKD